MTDDDACDWAAQIERGLAPAEQAQLEAWLEDDARNRGALLRARAAAYLLARSRMKEVILAERSLLSRGSLSRRGLIAAGSTAAALAGGAALWRFVRPNEPIATVTGEVRRVALDDGSLAVVNTTTALAVAYTARRRGIELHDGEAWFQVAKSASRPFLVACGVARAEALGTAFDVRRQTRSTQVIVTEGTVRIWSTQAPGAGMEVHSGQQAVIHDMGAIEISLVSELQTAQRLAWRDGKIMIDDMTLADAAAEFNRYNHVKILVDPSLADAQLVGWFGFHDVDAFVRATTTILDARADPGGGVIRIRKKFA